MNALTDRQAWLFSIKTYLAAVAALYIAMAGNLSRPYWAMGTVYIVSQPLLGPTRAKGVYRIVGTWWPAWPPCWCCRRWWKRRWC